MQTNNIEEAKIVSDSDDLLSRLNTATEVKNPATDNVAKKWNFDLDDKPQAPTPVVNSDDFDDDKKTDTPQNQPTDAPPKPEPKLSKDIKEASARITVSALDQTQKVVFNHLITRKYTKKFNDKEQKKLTETDIIDRDKETLADEDLTLRNKFDRLMKQQAAKIAAIPFTETEEKDLYTILYQYMDAKNKTLPPEIMLAISITNVLSKRAIDLFTD